jgi:hypothetical protein
MAINPAGVVLAKTQPTNLIPVDPSPTTLIDPDPGDMAPNPVGVALAKTMSTNSIPICSALTNAVPVDPDPINPSPVATNMCTLAAYAPVNCVYIMLAYPIPTDPNIVICTDLIHITPTEPVHVDPVLDTFPTRRALTSTSFVEFLFVLFFVFLE